MRCPHRYFPAVATALTILAAFIVVHGPTAAADTRPTIQQFLKIRTPGAPVVLPDGSLLTRDQPDGVFQLYHVAPGGSGEAPSYEPGKTTATKLTNYPDGLLRYSVSPDGKRVILMHAPGGNEYTALSLLELPAGAGAQARTLFASPRVQAAVNAWFDDGSGFLYSANADSPTDFHLYRWDFAADKATRVLAEAGSWRAADITRDGSRALVQKFVSISDAQVFELDLASGKLRDLTIRPADGTARCQVVGYMPGERAVLLRSDLEGGTSRLFVRDLESGKVREPLPALARFEVDGAATSETREYLVVVTNQEGYGEPSAYTLPDFKPVALPTMEKGRVGLASFRGSTLVWTNINARSPAVAYTTTFGKKGAPAATRQLTWTETQGIDLAAFQLPELIKYKTFDGREISAFMVLPPGYVKGTPIPFVIEYHGGPEGQHRPEFDPRDQYLVSRGFGILFPNVRGSTGYGREFHQLDDYKKRWDSVRDGVAAAEWLVANGYAAPGRIAASGGSYGGFMSVACVVEDQECVDRGERKVRVFGAGVDVVGIVNMKTFLEKTADYRRKLREVEYGPLEDVEFLRTVSSIHKADKINVPMFIAHGFNDPRVPVEEAMQLAVALKDRGQNPRVFIAPDEGHGFSKLDNRIYYYERMAAFLEETIGKAPAAKVAGAAQ